MTTPERPPGDDPADAYITEVGWGFLWRMGPSSGHEPTRELARDAVKRAMTNHGIGPRKDIA